MDWGNSQARSFVPSMSRADIDAGLRAHMLRVYNYMALALVVTGAVAFAVANSALGPIIFGTPLKWVAMLAPLAFVLVLSFGAHKMSFGTLQIVFWAFAAVMGLSIASILMVFTGASVARAFFMTAALFGALSLYGYTTKADLSKLGTVMTIGVVVLMVMSLINIFLGSSMLQVLISAAVIVVFLGLTAYDTQRIKEEYMEFAGHEALGKLAIMGALGLYLNFINIFQALMSLIGQRDE
ncbi:MAG: Bax inhibitor-1/YccA family protein [Alphaproteobacteria bacterium]|nr:Bax inhibitor-1/YccA family protein [Alphaproteobacteria bacterium]